MIEIACQTDSRLLPDCAVMLQSLLTVNRDETFRIHFLHDAGAPRDDWRILADLVTSFGAEWLPTPISQDRLEVLPFAAGYGGYTASYRLLLPDLLPDVPRVLYLDADTLVLDRIRPLWDIDLAGCCVAAATNPLYREMERRIRTDLGLPDRRAYFNSGVLLLDLDAMRLEGLDRALLGWAEANRQRIAWPDQDVLNAVLWSRRLSLHPRWNAASGLWDLPRRDLPWSSEEIDEARGRPAIAHFVGPYKPWHFRCTHPYRGDYHAYLARTGLPVAPLAGRSVRNRVVRRLPPLVQWTLENGPAEMKAEVRHHLSATGTGRELVHAYRRVRRRQEDPLALVLDALDFSLGNVTFIQIGSNDGRHDDPLRPFILAGQWQGILVEPVPYLFARLVDNYRGHRGIVPVNAAIGSADGVSEFFAVAPSDGDEGLPEWYDQIGSFSRAHVLKHAEYVPGLEDRIVSLEVPTLTFETLCARHGIARIDVLHIDAEGYDFDLVRGLDLHRRRPTLLLFEHKHMSVEERELCRELLEASDYEAFGVGWDTVAISRDAIANTWSPLARSWRRAKRVGSTSG